MTTAMLLLAVLQAADVAEPHTGVTFPTELAAPAGAPTQVLAGTGVRTRTMLKVKVYAFGLYVDPAGARGALGAWRGKTAAELGRDRAFYQELLKGGFPMTLRLVMTRDVGGAQMAEAFNDALGARVAQAAQRGMAGGDTALARFRGFFTDKLTSGTELRFAWTGGTALTVTIGGKEMGTIENAALAWALFDVYLGTKPISADGKKSVVARLPEVLAAS